MLSSACLNSLFGKTVFERISTNVFSVTIVLVCVNNLFLRSQRCMYYESNKCCRQLLIEKL